MIWQLINGLALGAVLCYAGMCVFALLFAHRMIFPAPPPSDESGAGYVKLPLRSGREITALYLENPEARHTILYSYGNGEDLGRVRPVLEQLRNRGFAVMAYDYPGYGTSEGRPSEQGCYEAIAAAFSYLVILRETDPRRIILYGRSLGGGPSYALAAQKPVAGLITEGTFTSTFRVITRRQILPWDVFDNLAVADRIACPVLVIHGTADRTVPFAHAEALYNAAREPKARLFVEGAGHNNLVEVAGTRYWDALGQFVESLPEPHE